MPGQATGTLAQAASLGASTGQISSGRISAACQARDKQVHKPLRPWLAQFSFQICNYFLPIFINKHLMRPPMGVALLKVIQSPSPTNSWPGALSDSLEARSPCRADSLPISLKVNQGFHGKLNNSAFPVFLLLPAMGQSQTQYTSLGSTWT